MRIDLGPHLDGLTEKIIRAAFTVSTTLGHGFLEIVYKNALIEELARDGLAVAKERIFSVSYRGKQVGRYVADIVVEDAVIAELKAVEALTRGHAAQLLNYLKASQIPVGLLLNFGQPSLEMKRVLL